MNPPMTTPMTTGTTRTRAVVAMLRWSRMGSMAPVSTAMLASAATVPITLRFIAGPFGSIMHPGRTGLGRLPGSASGPRGPAAGPGCSGHALLTAGQDVGVDSGPGGDPRLSLDGRAAAGQFGPAAALAGADHDLGDVVAAGELDQRAGRVVSVQLVPGGADVRCHLAHGGQTLIAGRPGDGVAGGGGDVKLGLDPGGQLRGAADDSLGARRVGDARHDALGGTPGNPGLIARQVFEEPFPGLTGKEPQR